jgi:hypothetical protein
LTLKQGFSQTVIIIEENMDRHNLFRLVGALFFYPKTSVRFGLHPGLTRNMSSTPGAAHGFALRFVLKMLVAHQK